MMITYEELELFLWGSIGGVVLFLAGFIVNELSRRYAQNSKKIEFDKKVK